MISAVQCRVSDELQTRLKSLKDDEPIEVVVELTAAPARPLGEQSGGRAAAVGAMKEEFMRHALPIEEAVVKSGGEVITRAWINQTLLIRVPARAVLLLSNLRTVDGLDVPAPIGPDD